MGIEIERRFLVKNDEWKSQVINAANFSQGYLNSNPDNWTLRVRIIDRKTGFLTLKSILQGFISHEFEFQIPIKDAFELLKLSKFKITKTRYQLKINGKDWVVDSFKDLNTSLTIAEIELESDLEKVIVPCWCGQEITGEKSLSNASLARTPISTLKLKDRLKDKDPPQMS